MFNSIRRSISCDDLMLLSSLLSEDQINELQRLHQVACKKYKKLQHRRHTTYAGNVKFQYGRWLMQYANDVLVDMSIFRMIYHKVLQNNDNDND